MSLVPVINMRPQKIILIGDHKQLPATLFCDNANFTRLERSLFERLHDGGKEIYTLTTQYRMHPDIRKFPSDQFYDGKLTDAAYINSPQRIHEFGQLARLDSIFKRSMFIDIAYARETKEELKPSRNNEDEADFTWKLIEALLISLGHSDLLKKRIGIVTPYRGQHRLLYE